MNLEIAAITIAIISLIISFYNTWRDRSRLKITSKIIGSNSVPEYGPVRIKISAVNKGKRPIYIRIEGGYLKSGQWGGTYIGDTNFGYKLEEGQLYESDWTIEKISFSAPDFDDEFKNIFLEDSLGKRYKVPNSERYINDLKYYN